MGTVGRDAGAYDGCEALVGGVTEGGVVGSRIGGVTSHYCIVEKSHEGRSSEELH